MDIQRNPVKNPQFFPLQKDKLRVWKTEEKKSKGSSTSANLKTAILTTMSRRPTSSSFALICYFILISINLLVSVHDSHASPIIVTSLLKMESMRVTAIVDQSPKKRVVQANDVATVAITTSKPTAKPTAKPSMKPTMGPTSRKPTPTPSQKPSVKPSFKPTLRPTTNGPTFFPTSYPTSIPSSFPSSVPSGMPSVKPTYRPTGSPTINVLAKIKLSQDGLSNAAVIAIIVGCLFVFSLILTKCLHIRYNLRMQKRAAAQQDRAISKKGYEAQIDEDEDVEGSGTNPTPEKVSRKTRLSLSSKQDPVGNPLHEKPSKSLKLPGDELDEYSEIHHLMSQKPEEDVFTKAFKTIFG